MKSYKTICAIEKFSTDTAIRVWKFICSSEVKLLFVMNIVYDLKNSTPVVLHSSIKAQNKRIPCSTAGANVQEHEGRAAKP